jgi:hypothetical protein
MTLGRRGDAHRTGNDHTWFRLGNHAGDCAGNVLRFGMIAEK